jgi:hypothetical protein
VIKLFTHIWGVIIHTFFCHVAENKSYSCSNLTRHLLIYEPLVSDDQIIYKTCVTK